MPTKKYIGANVNITYVSPCFSESAKHQGMRQALPDLMIQSWLCVTTVSFWYPNLHWLMHVEPCEHTYPQLSSAKSAHSKPVKKKNIGMILISFFENSQQRVCPVDTFTKSQFIRAKGLNVAVKWITNLFLPHNIYNWRHFLEVMTEKITFITKWKLSICDTIFYCIFRNFLGTDRKFLLHIFTCNSKIPKACAIGQINITFNVIVTHIFIGQAG